MEDFINTIFKICRVGASDNDTCVICEKNKFGVFISGFIVSVFTTQLDELY
jgi:hypothetical protein